MNLEYIAYLKKAGELDGFVTNLYGFGFTPTEIAALLGTGRSQVHDMINRRKSVIAGQVDQLAFITKPAAVRKKAQTYDLARSLNTGSLVKNEKWWLK